MAVTFHHRGDRGVVNFSGELGFESCLELAESIEVLVDIYHYVLVQIDVASPGGLISAFDRLRLVLEHFQARGVRFVTRVVSSAESAAAVMVSLGDVRVAEPGARLLYHGARGLNEVPSTAEATAALHATLLRADDGLTACLVERAMRGAPGSGPAPAEAEPSDLKVLELLAGRTRGRGPRDLQRRRRKLVRRLGRQIEKAVRSRDRDALERLYRSLFACEVPISAKLARTLRLVDHLGLPEPEAAQASDSSGLAVPDGLTRVRAKVVAQMGGRHILRIAREMPTGWPNGRDTTTATRRPSRAARSFSRPVPEGGETTACPVSPVRAEPCESVKSRHRRSPRWRPYSAPAVR